MNLSYEMFVFAVFQVIILGVFVAILKKLIECKPNPENTIITFGYLDKLLKKQKEDLFKEISLLREDIESISVDVAETRKQLIELLKSQLQFMSGNK